MGKPGPSHPADKDTMDMSQLFLARGKGQTSEHGGHSPPARGGQTWPTSPSTTPISVCVCGGGGREGMQSGQAQETALDVCRQIKRKTRLLRDGSPSRSAMQREGAAENELMPSTAVCPATRL